MGVQRGRHKVANPEKTSVVSNPWSSSPQSNPAWCWPRRAPTQTTKSPLVVGHVLPHRNPRELGPTLQAADHLDTCAGLPLTNRVTVRRSTPSGASPPCSLKEGCKTDKSCVVTVRALVVKAIRRGLPAKTRLWTTRSSGVLKCIIWEIYVELYQAVDCGTLATCRGCCDRPGGRRRRLLSCVACAHCSHTPLRLTVMAARAIVMDTWRKGRRLVRNTQITENSPPGISCSSFQSVGDWGVWQHGGKYGHLQSGTVSIVYVLPSNEQ